MLGKRFNKPVEDLEEYASTAEWCNNSGNRYTIEDKGDYFEVVEIPPPTPEEVKAQVFRYIKTVIDNEMNRVVSVRDYDSVDTLVSWLNSSNDIYVMEARAGIAYKDACIAYYYNLINNYDDTSELYEEEIIAGMPKIDW